MDQPFEKVNQLLPFLIGGRMNHKTLRNVVGLTSISALALALVGCGGSSSSAPATTTNQAPTNVQIVGPANLITAHPYTFNLSATDPEGDVITFNVNGTDLPAGQTSYVLTPTAVVSPAGTVLTVIAKDSKGAAAAARTHSAVVAANRAPQFVAGSPDAVLTGAGNTISMTYTWAAQDPDTDDVVYALKTGVTPTYVDNTGAAVTGCNVTVNAATGLVTFTGTVPTGKTFVRATFTLNAADKLPGGTTMLGASSDLPVTMTFYTGNAYPVITTTSINPVPLYHGIPTKGTTGGFQFTATDENTASLVWSLVSATKNGTAFPANAVQLSAAGLLTWTVDMANAATYCSSPTDAVVVVVKVRDNGGLETTKTFNVPLVADEVPNFLAQNYQETVGGVQFIDPSRVRQSVVDRTYFNWLDNLSTNGEFMFQSATAQKGWRAVYQATDAEMDDITYSIKVNSVFRYGAPFTTTTAANYPGIEPGPTATDPQQVAEIKWTPNRYRGSYDGDLPAGTYYDAAIAPTGDSLNDPYDPANWSFTVTAQEVINNVAIPGQAKDSTLYIKVQPNDRPQIGVLNIIYATTTPLALAPVAHGVYATGGSAITPAVVHGRPHIQQPLASDTATPASISYWIWQIGTPGTLNVAVTGPDYIIADPNSNGADGHQDAIKVDFGSRTISAEAIPSGALTGLISGTDYPALDTTGNYPAFNSANSLANGFYNPWIHGTTTSPGNFVVSWGPVRIQYTLSRYIDLGAYQFPIVAEDQYARARNHQKQIYPIFGTVRMFNSRFTHVRDTGSTNATRRGIFTAGGSNVSAASTTNPHNYIFSYIPMGYSNSGAAWDEWVDAATTVTYGSALFGQAVSASAWNGGPASGTDTRTASVQFTAGNWHTVDGRDALVAAMAGFYSVNPLNVTLNPATRADAVPGTTAPSAQTYTQFTNGTPQGKPVSTMAQVTVNVSGRYSNNEAMARVIPSNSPYLFTEPNVVKAYDNDARTARRQMNHPYQGSNAITGGSTLGGAAIYNLGFGGTRWYYGKVQSEVDYGQKLAGRPIYDSATFPTIATDVDGFNAAVSDVRLRLSFSWPTLISNTAAPYPAAGGPNLFTGTDIVQVATPNMSGNGRFFFTGNYQGVNEQAAGNWFGKFGFTAAPTFTSTGATVTAAPHQPIHAVTNSIWVPNNVNDKYNFPNQFTTPAGGSGYTDIPFSGIKGYIANAANNALRQLWTVNDLNLDARRREEASLKVGRLLASNIDLVNGVGNESTANPGLLEPVTASDRTVFLWMKQDPANINAYGTWAGSVMVNGSQYNFAGGTTTAPLFVDMLTGADLPATGLFDTQAQISFAQYQGQLGAQNQAPTSGVGVVSWLKSQFHQMRSVMGSPQQWGLTPRVTFAQPGFDVAVAPTIDTDWNTAAGTDGNSAITQNSMVVYAVRGQYTAGSTFGEAGIPASTPILAQWWNHDVKATNYAGAPADDILGSAFPGVMNFYSGVQQNNGGFLLPTEWTEVVHINHNFTGKVEFPGLAAGSELAKVNLQIGLVAPVGHSLLTDPSGVRPVVTPVRQLAINDFLIDEAHDSGTHLGTVGTKLDIFNGNAVNAATGAPAATAPSYKLVSNNGIADHTLSGDSNIQISFQPMVNDLRHPSGYVISIYNVTTVAGYTAAARTNIQQIREIRCGHIGGIGALQTINLPSFRVMDPNATGAQTQRSYVVKVRNVWMEGTEGVANHSFDLGKEPFGVRLPMAYADVLSGTFVVDFD
jgi:hypothetical protein